MKKQMEDQKKKHFTQYFSCRNMMTICRHPGGEQFEWFFLVANLVELAAAPAYWVICQFYLVYFFLCLPYCFKQSVLWAVINPASFN